MAMTAKFPLISCAILSSVLAGCNAPGDTTAAKCLSRESCGENEYCTTETGDCQSACEPGAEMCIEACAGVCRPISELPDQCPVMLCPEGTTCRNSECLPHDEEVSCAPYVCADGTQHPSCSEDGHVINYFADPCLTHGGYPGEGSSDASAQSS
jgi:hypothetical protein